LQRKIVIYKKTP